MDAVIIGLLLGILTAIFTIRRSNEMGEQETPEEQLNPREQPNPEEVTEEHTHDVFTTPSELTPEVVETLEEAGFELSTEETPEPPPDPEPPIAAGPETDDNREVS